MNLQKLFLTFFGSGLSPKAPGTAGSLAALPVGVAILYFLGLPTLFMVTLAISIVAIFEINKYENITKEHDQKEIVIDEAVGIWITLMVAYQSAISATFPYAVYVAIGVGFGAFRLFDIWKPSTIGWIDREIKGGLGVMGDDIMAGFAGGFLTVAVIIAIEKMYA